MTTRANRIPALVADAVRDSGLWTGLWAGRWSGGGLALVLLCLAVYLPGLTSIAPVDRDECRFAQASRQMFEAAALPAGEIDVRRDASTGGPVGLHAGGWAIPMYGTTPRLNKPPLVYWLQVASAWAFTGGVPGDDAMWMYRVPSVLCAIGTVLVTWRVGRRMYSGPVGLLAGALVAVCPMVVWDAHQARADQLLVFTTTVMMAALWRVYRPGLDSASKMFPTRGWAVWFWLALAASVLAKGPIGLLVAAGTVGLICLMPAVGPAGTSRRDFGLLKRLECWWGVPLAVAMIGAWVWMVVAQVGWASYLAILNDEVVKRATVGSKEGHSLPPGTHTLLLAALFWPGSLLTLAGIARAWAIGLPRRERSSESGSGLLSRVKGWFDRTAGRTPELFLLGWIVPAWIVFELVTSKLPHYTMPMFPAIAIVSARMVFGAGTLLRRGQMKVSRAGNTVWWMIGFIPMLGITVLAGLAAIGEVRPVLAVVAIAGAAGMGLLGVAVRRLNSLGDADRATDQPPTPVAVRSQVLSVLATAIVLGSAMQWLMPSLAPGSKTVEIMDQVSMVTGHATLPIASTYHEDSMVFATRGRVERLAVSQVAAFFARHPQSIVISRRGELASDPAVTSKLVLHRASNQGSQFDVWGPEPTGTPPAPPALGINPSPGTSPSPTTPPGPSN